MKTVLESAALILGLVNGLFLLRLYTRDRARLKVSPVHPDSYQWWFQLPDGERNGQLTRRWGFLLYLSASNPGLRPTSLNRWRLKVRASNGSAVELKPLSIREPSVELSGNLKVYPVLGARGLFHDGDTRLEPGGGTSGMAYYVYECFGGAAWDPAVNDGVIRVRLLAEEVFGGKARCNVDCNEKPLDEIEKLVPGISTTGLENGV